MSETRHIPLGRRTNGSTAVALVDAENFDRVWGPGQNWYLHSAGYAVRRASTKDGRRTIYLAREVLRLSPEDPRKVVFKNGNRLDCRKENLRVVGEWAGSAKGPSRFRGVSAKGDAWAATVRVGKRQHWLGTFEDELEAAVAAERGRQKLLAHSPPDPELIKALKARLGQGSEDASIEELLARWERRK